MLAIWHPSIWNLFSIFFLKKILKINPFVLLAQMSASLSLRFLHCHVNPGIEVGSINIKPMSNV